MIHLPNKGLLTVGMLLLFSLFAGCTHQSSSDDATATIGHAIEAEKPIVVHVAGVKSIGQTPFVIAEKMGYLKDAGLSLETTWMAGGDQVFKALTSQSVDIGLVGLVPFGFVARDFPSIKLLTVLTDLNDTKLITNSSIKSPDELQGKKIAYTKSTASDIFMQKFLKRHNLSTKDVTLINLSPAALPTAFAAGEIDGYAAREPNIYNGSKLLSGKVTLFDTNTDKYERYFSLFADSSYDKNITNKLIIALTKAEDYIATHPTETKQIMSDFLGIKGDVIEKIWSDYNFHIGIEQKHRDALLDILNRAATQKGLTPVSDISPFISQ